MNKLDWERTLKQMAEKREPEVVVDEKRLASWCRTFGLDQTEEEAWEDQQERSWEDLQERLAEH